MHVFWNGLGWTLMGVAALFSLGISTRWAHYFYPEPLAPSRRAAAPVLFALLAVACFSGAGFPVLVMVAACGALQSMLARRALRRASVPNQQ